MLTTRGLAALVRAQPDVDAATLAAQLGVRPSEVRRIRARGDRPGRPAGSGSELRVRLPPAIDSRLRARAAQLGLTPAVAAVLVLSEALKAQ